MTTWQAHTGEDYTVVMRDNEGTDNASIRVHGDDAEKLGEQIAAALNEPAFLIPSLASLSPEERAKLDEMMADMPRNFGGGLIMPSDTPKEAWFYDAASRTIYDENRLAVARDVGIDDANRILKAVGCETEYAIIGEAQPSPLFAILADMLAYEAAKFDAEPVEFDVYDAAEKRSRGGFKSREEAEAAARQIPGATVLDVYDDLDVSGADLVDAFTAWREQLKAALDTARPAPLVALAREAAALFREYEAHHRAKASEAGRPEKAERNADIAGRLEAALG